MEEVYNFAYYLSLKVPAFATRVAKYIIQRRRETT